MGVIDYICVFVDFATAFVGIIYLIYYFFYKESYEYLKSLNKMPFKSFVAFYNIAPIKWTLNKNYVVYKTIKDNIYRTPMKEYGFTFKLLDLIKYRIWHRGILHNEKVEKKKHEQKERYKQYQEALKEISKDLEQFKQLKPWEDIK